METQQHPIVAVLDTLRRDAAVLQDTSRPLVQRERAQVRFEANLRALGVDFVDARKLAKAVA
jgi:hypothetical protein